MKSPSPIPSLNPSKEELVMWCNMWSMYFSSKNDNQLDFNIYIFRPGFTLPTYNPSVRSAPQVSWCQNVYLAKSVIPNLNRSSTKSEPIKRGQFHTSMQFQSNCGWLWSDWGWLLSSIVWSGLITKEMSLRRSKHCWKMKNLLMWVF